MKSTGIKKSAFTYVELIIVVAIIAVLLSMLLPAVSHSKAHAPRITCVNDLKQIGTGYRIWANDRHGHYPAMESVTNGGWSDFLKNANEGGSCWMNYAIMSNELGMAPKLLACPSDERKPAESFSNFNSNIHLSYFVGVSADNAQPQSLLGGDRNLGSGTNAANDYGFSPENGSGNDVAIAINPQAGPISWSSRIHSGGNSVGAGNILLGDGSVQQVTSGSLQKIWQPHFEPTTNWPANRAPAAPSIRVLFP